MPAPTVAHLQALILAAGRGRRMGGPKALLEVCGQPWWRIQSKRLAAAGVPATWVVSGSVRAAMASHADAPTGLIDGDSDAPMFASILAGLRTVAHTPPFGVFVLPVDAPVPEPGVWGTLAAASGGETPVTIPTFQGKAGHPAFLRWSWIADTLFPAVESAPDHGTLRLDTLIAPVARHVAVADPCVAVNLNTPDDLAAYLADFG